MNISRRGLFGMFAAGAGAAIIPAGILMPIKPKLVISQFDPILLSLVRRTWPILLAREIIGVQPMTGPAGLVFAMRNRYGNQV